MIFNLGSSTPTFPLMISGYPNAVVTVTNGKKTYTLETDNDGNATFEKMTKGTWTVTVTAGDESTSLSVDISKESSNTLDINAIPKFTYTGSYQIVDDDNNEITASLNNWKIRFLTSGTLVFTNLNGAAEGIDVFCVGGGAGGSGSEPDSGWWQSGNEPGGTGGFNTVATGMLIATGTEYIIRIGAGGAGADTGVRSYSPGGESTAFNRSALGGSGGGTSNLTYEFGGSSGKQYGEVGAMTGSANGDANTGNGGSSATVFSNNRGGSGGSGIVIIRNAR